MSRFICLFISMFICLFAPYLYVPLFIISMCLFSLFLVSGFICF